MSMLPTYERRPLLTSFFSGPAPSTDFSLHSTMLDFHIKLKKAIAVRILFVTRFFDFRYVLHHNTILSEQDPRTVKGRKQIVAIKFFR